jgi:hypothetical protein
MNDLDSDQESLRSSFLRVEPDSGPKKIVSEMSDERFVEIIDPFRAGLRKMNSWGYSEVESASVIRTIANYVVRTCLGAHGW